MRKTNKGEPRPWLTPTGVEIQTAALRELSAAWDHNTWVAYLKWYESGCNEALVHPDNYGIICEEQTNSIFEQFAQNASQENRGECERVLATLPLVEALVLERYFLEGLTEVEIAFQLKRSQTGISLIKNRALARLKRGNRGDEMLPRHIMRGENSFCEEPSIWDEPLHHPLKEDRPYDPNNHKVEFDQIKTSSIRDALLRLSDTAQRILYLRYWCGYSVNHVARVLGRGVNVIEQIESTSIFKVKSNALEFELGNTFGGSQCF